MEQKGPLVERRVTREAKVTRKYPPGSSRIKVVRVREGVVRANEEGPRTRRADVRVWVQNGPLKRQKSPSVSIVGSKVLTYWWKIIVVPGSSRMKMVRVREGVVRAN